MQNWIYQQGFEYGKAKAEAEATANAVLKVLALRGLRVSKASRERILREADQDTLDRWLKRAVTVKKAAEIFEELAKWSGRRLRLARGLVELASHLARRIRRDLFIWMQALLLSARALHADA